MKKGLHDVKILGRSGSGCCRTIYFFLGTNGGEIGAGPACLLTLLAVQHRLAIPHHRCQRRVVEKSMSLMFVALRQFTN